MPSSRKRRDATPEVAYIGLTEGAALVGVHFKTLRRWISEGKLTGYKLAGGPIRIDRAELLGLAKPMAAAVPPAASGRGVA